MLKNNTTTKRETSTNNDSQPVEQNPTGSSGDGTHRFSGLFASWSQRPNKETLCSVEEHAPNYNSNKQPKQILTKVDL